MAGLKPHYRGLLFFEPKSSGHIARVEYFPGWNRIVVNFKNGESWAHYGVPFEAYRNFSKYHSAGQFYHGVIKRYKGEKLLPAESEVKKLEKE